MSKIIEYLKKNASNFTTKELIDLIYIKYNKLYTSHDLRQLMRYNNIEWKRNDKIFNKDKYNYFMKIGKNYTMKELYEISKSKFNEKSFNSFKMYMMTNKIPYRYMYENKALARRIGKLPIGSEYTNKNKITRVKSSNQQWVEKQRYVYEKYHNVKLKPNEYVIFLDDNKTNYDINNLYVVNVKVAGGLNNLKSKNKDATRLGINISKLRLKTKELKRELKEGAI